MIYYSLSRQGIVTSCRECREKGLDRVGNCPFRPMEEHNPNIVYNVAGEPFPVCPVPLIDEEAKNDLVMANLLWQFGILPTSGGFLEQPYEDFKVAQILAAFLAEEEARRGKER